MSDAARTLRTLIAMQQLDSRIDALDATLAKAGPAAENVKSQCAAKRAALDAHREARRKILLHNKELDRVLAETEASVAKHQADLNNVKTNEAFKALQVEIDGLKAKADAAQDNILAGMEEAEASSAREKELAEAFARDEAAAAEMLAKIEKSRAALEQEIAGLSAERAALAAPIAGSAVLSRYEQLRKTREGLGICEVRVTPTGPNCSGCNMRILAHTSGELKKTGALVFCDNCQRIIYTADTLGSAA